MQAGTLHPWYSWQPPLTKNHYRIYCEIRESVIKEAKQKYHKKQIQNADNKIIFWSIVQKVTNKLLSDDEIASVSINII
jgi:hypothetical protein